MIIPRNGLSMEDMVNLVAFDYNVAKVTIDEELIDIIFPRVTHPDPRFITDVFLTLRVIINYLILLDFWGLEMVDAKTGVMRRN